MLCPWFPENQKGWPCGALSKKPQNATPTKKCKESPQDRSYLVVPPIEGEDADDKGEWDDDEDEDTDESSDDSDPGFDVNPVYKSKAKPSSVESLEW
jgi:hypothetical protein